MEFDDIKSYPGGDHETSFQEFTRVRPTTLESTGISQHEQTEKCEGLCEKSRLERYINDKKTEMNDKENEIPEKIKCFIYIILASVIVLYIGTIALTIAVALPKEQDGGWSNWEIWSACTESCGGGIKWRNRSCSNPAPSVVGKQCLGNSEQVGQCNKQLCPGTDGGWSNWENWSPCTESCGGGIKWRNRSCSNPAPSVVGKQCLGNSELVGQCNKQLCPGTDGGWSNWETWSTCSESCGGGIKSRKRSCSSPLPSLYGKQCLGSLEQVNQCNKQLCPGTDGGWSLWEDWGTCTDSCGGGVRTRSRSCTNPTPSLTGRHCTGDYTDVSTCNKTTCPEHNVAFTAYHILQNSSITVSSILLFQKTHINIGDGFDTITGKFTCNIPGVYHFVVTLTKIYRYVYLILAYLRINGRGKLYLNFTPKIGNEVGVYMMTGAGTFHLNQNDVVAVYGIPNYFKDDLYSYFTWFLITPDQ